MTFHYPALQLCHSKTLKHTADIAADPSKKKNGPLLWCHNRMAVVQSPGIGRLYAFTTLE